VLLAEEALLAGYPSTPALVLRHITLGLAAALVLAAMPLDLGAQRPAMPRVRPAPCEEVPYCYNVWASCARVTLRSEPSQTAPVAAVLDSGLRVKVVTGQMRTVSPGVVVARRADTLVEQLDTPDERVTPPNPKRWRLRAGDTLYVVDRQGDGDSYANFTWIYRGQEATTASFWLEPDEEAEFPEVARVRSLRMVAPMKQEWWVRVLGPKGQTGWTRRTSEWSGTSYYDDSAEKCAP